MRGVRPPKLAVTAKPACPKARELHVTFYVDNNVDRRLRLLGLPAPCGQYTMRGCSCIHACGLILGG